MDAVGYYVQAEPHVRQRLVCCQRNQHQTLYNAVARLRKKACQIPGREQNEEVIHDLTAKSLPDVVPVSIIPETKTGFSAAPALQDAAMHYDNSHMVKITTGNQMKSLRSWHHGIRK